MSTPSSTASSSDRHGLTVAIISHDDQALLPATLDSVRGLADEVLVIECGSAGHTAGAIARYGARIVPWQWSDDFSALRNTALDRARGAWILWLQPGEQLTAPSASEIRQFIADQPMPTRALLLSVEVPSPNSMALSEEVAELRLLPALPGVRYEGRIGESARASLAGCGVAVELSPWRILRVSLDGNDEAQRARALRDLKLLDLELQDRPNAPRALTLLGEIQCAYGQLAAARQRFQQSINNSEPGSTEMLAAYYGLLTTFDDRPQSHEQQLSACLAALEIYPFDAQLLCAMGGYLWAKGQHETACRSYQAALDFGQLDPETWHVHDPSELAASCMVLCRMNMGQDDAARSVAEETLARLPEAHRLRRHLIHLHVKHSRSAEALAEVDRLPKTTPCREGLRSAVRGACQAARENWIPALAYLETAHAAGCRDPLCLRWYAVTLLASGNKSQAEAVLAEWRAAEPHNAEVEQFIQAAKAGGKLPQRAIIAAPIVAAVPRSSAPLGAAKDDELWAALPTSKNAAPMTEDIAEATDVRKLRIDSAKAPWDASLHIRLGDAYRQVGDDQAAEAVWREFLRRYPDSPQVIQALAELLIKTNQTSEAVELVGRIRQPGPAQKPFIDFVQGVAADDRGRHDQACDSFASARRGGYQLPTLYERWAVSLTKLGRFNEAQQVLGERMQLRSPSAPHHNPRSSSDVASLR